MAAAVTLTLLGLAAVVGGTIDRHWPPVCDGMTSSAACLIRVAQARL